MVIDWVVSAPGVQLLSIELLDVRTTLSPWQNVVGPPAVIVGTAGKGSTVTTVTVEESVQPAPVVSTT